MPLKRVDYFLLDLGEDWREIVEFWVIFRFIVLWVVDDI